mgnify:CR=1 FL=1
MANRYLGGERPAPRRPPDSSLALAWGPTLEAYRHKLEECLLHEALAALWEFVGAANRVVDAEQPWVLAKAARTGDELAGARLRGVLGDLVEACRLVGLAAAPFLPGTAPRIADLLGLPAVSTEGEALGECVGVENFGAGDVIEIRKADGKTFMVPMKPQAVPEWTDERIVIEAGWAE